MVEALPPRQPFQDQLHMNGLQPSQREGVVCDRLVETAIVAKDKTLLGQQFDPGVNAGGDAAILIESDKRFRCDRVADLKRFGSCANTHPV
jgi:hypothetical protein